MTFRSKGARTYKVRVTTMDGAASRTCSTGRQTKRDADAVARLVRQWRGKEGRHLARPDVLDLIVRARRLTLVAAYDAAVAGTLDALVASLAAEATAQATAARDDLRRHLGGWEAWKRAERTGAAQAGRYRREVERLYPAGEPLTRDTFTARELTRRIAGLPGASEGTRSRYKAAALSFGRYLVLEGVLPHNPARDAAQYAPSTRRTVYYDRRTAQDVLARLPQPYAAMEALMAGWGLEWRAVTQLRASDVSLTDGTVVARGTKTAARARTCVLLQHNRWVLPYVRAALQGKVGDALVFAGHVPALPPVGPDAPRAVWLAYQRENIRYNKRALDAHRAAVEAAGAAPSTLHDWRHTYAVCGLRDGYSESAIAHNLGHSSTLQLREVYGRFIPLAEDFQSRFERPTDDRREAR